MRANPNSQRSSGCRIAVRRVSPNYGVCCGMILLGAALFAAPLTRAQAQAAPLPHSPQAQKPRVPYSLEMLIAQSNWQAERRGPLIAVDPRLVYAVTTDPLPTPDQDGYDLRQSAPHFVRMLANIGTVSVLAPVEMTLIEDNPRDPPNLYDGLPRELKVKYLMATLTPAQWKTLGDKGLGLDDLSGEQQAVYLSLLPKPFVYERLPLDAKGQSDEIWQKVTLTPEQRTQVRLRVHRKVSVMVAFADERSYTSAFETSGDGPPNGELRKRNTDADDHSTTLFGVSLSRTVPNKSKPSQLNYAASRLDAVVSLVGAHTVGDLIARVGIASRLEVAADGRVASLPLMLRGAQARAGDVLKALALAVTGTFRKVDTAYVLTSDLTGIGARQLRLAEWQAQIKEEVTRREAELTKQIALHSGQGRGIMSLGYAPDDPLALTPAVDEEARQRMFYSDRDIPTEKLTPALQNLIHSYPDYFAKHYANQGRLRDDVAWLNIGWGFTFQLPGGAALPDEAWVGNATDYYTPPPLPKPAVVTPPPGANLPPPGPGPLLLPAWAKERLLFLTPRTREEAVQAAQAARRLGFTILVLNTEDKTLLAAAIAQAAGTQTADSASHSAAGSVSKSAAPVPKSALRVCAAVAPFAAPALTSGIFRSPDTKAVAPALADQNALDANLLGETAAQIVSARSVQPHWQAFQKQTVEHRMHTPEKLVGVQSALAPLAENVAARWKTLADLGAVKGLAGMFCYDTQPDGYAGAGSGFVVSEPALLERANLGYTPAMRAAFLRKEGVDPLDLNPVGLYLDVNLPLPFFPNISRSGRLPGSAFVEEKDAQWDAFRGDANRAAMQGLYAALRAARPDLPLMIEARAAVNNAAYRALEPSGWTVWAGPDSLSAAAAPQSGGSRVPLSSAGRALTPFQFSMSDQMPAQMWMGAIMRMMQAPTPVFKGQEAVLFDMMYLPPARALSLLNEYVAPVSTTAASK